MTFGVTVDQPAGVERAELFFPDANVTEPMTQSAANTWILQRPMTQPGANRPYVVKLVRKGGAVVQANGTYSVSEQPQPQPQLGEVPPAVGCQPGGVKICGVDGRTYPNVCTLNKFGVAKRSTGPC